MFRKRRWWGQGEGEERGESTVVQWGSRGRQGTRSVYIYNIHILCICTLVPQRHEAEEVFVFIESYPPHCPLPICSWPLVPSRQICYIFQTLFHGQCSCEIFSSQRDSWWSSLSLTSHDISSTTYFIPNHTLSLGLLFLTSTGSPLRPLSLLSPSHHLAGEIWKLFLINVLGVEFFLNPHILSSKK